MHPLKEKRLDCMIKLIATDMDGTLLDAQGQFDNNRFEKILDQLEERRIKFVVATGNEIGRMRKLFDQDLMGRMTFVVANGARIFEGNSLLAEQHWDKALVQDVLAYFAGKERDYHLVANLHDGAYALEGMTFPMVEKFMTQEMAKEFYKQIHFIKNFQELDQTAIIKMSLVVDEEQASQVTRQINRQFEEKLNAVTSGFGAIDLLPIGIHKGWGLRNLMKRWNIEEHQIMAFGDSENDVEMLEMAGIAYAMENADDETKAVATALAPANSQGGVYQVLENWLEKEG